jgi:hypothetical protein
MSNLYVRLHSSFWTHRKTLQLRRKLGDAAFWIPPRLWSFAAENAPNGDLSNYQAEDLAMLVQYSGDARSMLKALHEAGFLENGVIRNWEERNSFHVTNHDRAKKAAEARWAKRNEKLSEKKERDIEKEKEKEIKQALTKQCLVDAPSMELEKLRLRIGSWFKRRESTVWSPKEIKALKDVIALKTPPEDINALEARYLSGNPYLRRDIITLLNNWNTEIDRANQPTTQATSANANDPIARRNALLGDDVERQQAEAARISRARYLAEQERFERTGLTPFDEDLPGLPVEGHPVG